MAFAEQEMTRLWGSLGCRPLHYAYVVYDEIADLLRKHGGKTAEELKAEGK
tara:strand:- start:147 stop:299 length:153 start_codon:yes stop_codon:yes gene_type:complete